MSSGYSFISLDPLLPAVNSVDAINNSGQLAGTYTDSGGISHGFTWKNGVLTAVDVTALPSPNYVTVVTGINDVGDVTGYDELGNGGLPFGFVVKADGTVSQVQGFFSSQPVGIDNAGAVVANASFNGTNVAVIVSSSGVAQQLLDPSGAAPGATHVEGINAAGTEVVGYTDGVGAFVYDGTTYTHIAPTGVASGVNDFGQVVGTYSDETGSHGFIYDGSTVLTFDYPLAVNGTSLLGINDFGQIIGTYVDGSNQTHEFLATLDQLNQTQVTGILTPMMGAATGQIIAYLHSQGLLLDGATMSDTTGNFAPDLLTTQLLIVAGSQESVTSNAALKFVVNSFANSNLVIHGSADIGVASAVGNDSISLQDSGNDTVFLAAGNNTVWAGAGVDTVYGGRGNDMLIAGTGQGSQFYGGDGNDVFVGGTANSYVDGGAGDDTIYGGTGNDALHGGGGHDVIYAGDGSSYLFADTGQSTLYGGSGSDTLYAGSGDARLVALGSQYNELYGGSGNSVLLAAGTGNTLMVAGSGNNYLQAGGGSDTLYGGVGSDTLQAGSGSDRLISGSEAGLGGQGNLLLGGSGNSALFAGSGNDTLYAGSGQDTLVSGAGSSYLVGSNAGNATFEIAYHTGNDSVIASGGGNIAYIDGRASTDGTIVTGDGQTTITFADTGQVLHFSGVQQIHFTDGVYSP